jgi:hypothetical protein
VKFKLLNINSLNIGNLNNGSIFLHHIFLLNTRYYFLVLLNITSFSDFNIFPWLFVNISKCRNRGCIDSDTLSNNLRSSNNGGLSYISIDYIGWVFYVGYSGEFFICSHWGALNITNWGALDNILRTSSESNCLIVTNISGCESIFISSHFNFISITI